MGEIINCLNCDGRNSETNYKVQFTKKKLWIFFNPLEIHEGGGGGAK